MIGHDRDSIRAEEEGRNHLFSLIRDQLKSTSSVEEIDFHKISLISKKPAGIEM